MALMTHWRAACRAASGAQEGATGPGARCLPSFIGSWPVTKTKLPMRLAGTYAPSGPERGGRVMLRRLRFSVTLMALPPSPRNGEWVGERGWRVARREAVQWVRRV